MKRFNIVFIGRVQGVGFRWTIINIAHKYNIVGFCRNLYNGDVEAEIQGNTDNLDAFLKEVLEPRTYIRIDDYIIREISINDEESSFEVIY